MPTPVTLGARALRTARAVRHFKETLRDAVPDGVPGREALLARARTLPIQRSVDVAVPIDVAWDHWMEFEHLPEGTHRVTSVERDGEGRLVGRLEGPHLDGTWEAEIVDERIDESFAWHSVGGSDTSGLITFHELSDRLTRLELHLDVIPGGVSDAMALMLRVADRRAEAELRRFKAEVEALDPDEYPPPQTAVDDNDEEE
jgi:uncharacterized membrane protein